MSQPILVAAIKGLHDLFSAVWIGGLITLGLAMMPAARNLLGNGPDLKHLMDAVQARLSKLIYVSMFGLIVTGMLEARRAPEFQGLFSFGSTYSIVLGVKHILVIAMVVIALYRSLVLSGRRGLSSPHRQKLNQALMLANIALGVAVLLLSGMNGALG